VSGASTHPARFWAFIVFMLVLTASFVALGARQLQRLDEKQALVAAVEERANLPPAPPPSASGWVTLDPAEINFVPLALVGRFADEPAIRVFTSLSISTARGQSSGPGYWIVSPFALDAGGTIFVNRGFVPQGRENEFTTPPAGPMTITGLARAPEGVLQVQQQAGPLQEVARGAAEGSERVVGLVAKHFAGFASSQSLQPSVRY
jgi:surfeit locus 1 family protein